MPPPPKLSSLYHSPTLLLLLLLLLSVILFSSLHRRHHHPSPFSSSSIHSQNTPQTFRHLFSSLSPSSNSSISSHLKTLTLRPHLAGTPPSAATAAYLLSHFRLSGLQTLTANYTPLLSYPSSSSLSLLRPDQTLPAPLSLSEPADPAAAFVPPYHAYSPSGSAVGPAVFVNYGRSRDYEALERLGVNVRGCVAVVRRGVGPRGAVVEKAAERGAAVVLMYGDKAPEDGVERGMVLIGGPGDLLTPGWGAVAGPEEGERLGMEDEEVRKRVPRIPSMPVSAETAREVARRLSGPRVPEGWKSGIVKEWGGVGGGGGGVFLNFTYEVEFF